MNMMLEMYVWADDVDDDYDKEFLAALKRLMKLKFPKVRRVEIDTVYEV